MRPLTLVLITLMLPASEMRSQLHSVEFYGSGSFAASKRLGVTRAEGFGGGVTLRFTVAGPRLLVGILAGYDQLSVSQDSALEKWNWRFWVERYAGIVRDNLASDSSLSASLVPEQRLDMFPLVLTIGTEFRPAEGVVVRPIVGAGMVFYTRRLFLNETWSKRFAAADYTFEYSYRNFAQDKPGNPVIFLGGLEVGIRLTEFILASASGRYVHTLATEGKLGYGEYPLSAHMTFSAGLTFLY